MSYLLGYLITVNIITFAVYALDKAKARHGAWRIPERTLFLLAAAGGSAGALAGMYLLRHKTQHRSFTLGIPAILLLQIAAGAFVWYRSLR